MRLLLRSVAVSASLASPVLAAIATWAGGAGNGLWADPLNWSTNAVPTANDIAVLSNVTVDLGGMNRRTYQLEIGSTVTLKNGSVGAQFLRTSAGVTTLNGNVFGTDVPFLVFGASTNSSLRLNGALSSSDLNFVGLTLLTPINTMSRRTFTSSTLSEDGTVGAMDVVVSAVMTLDNTAKALSNRLNANTTLTMQSKLLNRLRVVGNAETAIEESIQSVVSRDVQTSFVLEPKSAIHFHVNSFDLGPDTALQLVVSDPTLARLTTNVAPQRVGGTGGVETPILKNAYAQVGPSFDSVTNTRTFLTYDTTSVAGETGPKGVVGYRPLRDSEFVTDLASATALSNVSISGVVAASAPRSFNVLKIDSGAELDLADADLTTTAGVVLRGGVPTGVTTLRASGSGRLVSPVVLDVITGSRSLAYDALTIAAPIAAPKLTILGGGSMTLSGANDLPGGVRVVNSVLRVASPAALGSGPLEIKYATVTFDGNPTIPNAVRWSSGEATANSVSYSGGSYILVNTGQTVTFTGPGTGAGLISTRGDGLLRLVGGGEFVGEIGQTRGLSGATRIELGGEWKLPAGSAFQDINAKGTLFGTGRAAVIFNEGTISAGSPGSVGVFTINRFGGFVSPSSTITIQVDVAGTTADQIITTLPRRTFDDPRVVLSVNSLAPPTPGSVYTIVRDDAAGTAISKFLNLNEGDIFSAGLYGYRVSYVGGDGNDVTLTVVPEPAVASVITLATASLAWRGRRVRSKSV